MAQAGGLLIELSVSLGLVHSLSDSRMAVAPSFLIDFIEMLSRYAKYVLRTLHDLIIAPIFMIVSVCSTYTIATVVLVVGIYFTYNSIGVTRSHIEEVSSCWSHISQSNSSEAISSNFTRIAANLGFGAVAGDPSHRNFINKLGAHWALIGSDERSLAFVLLAVHWKEAEAFLRDVLAYVLKFLIVLPWVTLMLIYFFVLLPCIKYGLSLLGRLVCYVACCRCCGKKKQEAIEIKEKES